MKKVFISQPMRDKSDEEILAVRKRAIAYAKDILKTSDIEVIDSFFQNAPIDAKPLWFVGKSLELLSDADFVVFAPNYQEYRGCQIQQLCCTSYCIPHVIMEEL